MGGPFDVKGVFAHCLPLLQYIDMEIKINKQTNNIQDTTAAIVGLLRLLENTNIKELRGNYIFNVEIRKVEHFNYEDIDK